MKNKRNLKQIREQQKETSKARYRQEAERKAELEREQRRQEERDQQRAQALKDRKLLEDFRDTSKQDLKSRAKAAGLKSTFVLGDNHLLMTSFGKGNRALLEKDIVNREIVDLNPQAVFQTRPDRERYLLDGRIPNASTDDPLHNAPQKEAAVGTDEVVASKEASGAAKAGEDLLHCKDALERRFFGSTFEDNIHIQLIYNILDMEKLLTVHINNIIYALTNQLREKIENYEEVIGNISWFGKPSHDYDSFVSYCTNNIKKNRLLELFQKLAHQKQLGYYGIEVTADTAPNAPRTKDKPKADPNALQVTEAEFYMMVSTLGQIRQGLAHGRYKELTRLYTENGFNTAAQAVMDRLYRQRVELLNADFLEKAKTDLAILFKAFEVSGIEAKRSYVRDYYDFIIRKEYKNQGFSIKTLREAMTLIIDEARVIKDEKYNTFRQKINRCIDFAIYRYYLKRPEEIQAMVDSLRACLEEDEKLDTYSIEARRVWPALRDLVLNHILVQMNEKGFHSIGTDSDVSSDMLEGVKITAEATSFSKLIYMMTLFMDGKEINDLVTSLINKLENIGSFIDVLQELGLSTDFSKDYRLFDRSWNVAGELRIVNSFARMRRESTNAKRQMFIEASRVLGEGSSIEVLEAYWDDKLETRPKSDGKKREMGVRNFIINNVIDSQRFRYLIRYADISNVSQLAQSAQLVRYVLKEIPDAQILRYYNACYGDDRPYDPTMREALAAMLIHFSFEELRDVRNNDREMNRQQQEEKRQKQAIVRLYLTVLYLAVKNLVYINSRYFMAFHCVERDRILYDSKKWDYFKSEWANTDPNAYGLAAFAKTFLNDHPPKARVRRYLEQNFANSDNWAINAFRNKIEHLDAVRSVAKYIKDVRQFQSWYELYHYILQRTIIDQYDFDSRHKSKNRPGEMIISEEALNPKMLKYGRLVMKHGGYCRDAVKALCVPFAYNLPRYKNLSIEGLFDKNRPGKKGSGRIDAQEEE